MEKASDSTGLFVNDGSFMEKFKQLQQEQGKEKQKHPIQNASSGTATTPKLVIGKTSLSMKVVNSGGKSSSQSASSGKLAFSLKQKSKLVAPPVKLSEEDEEEEETGNGSDDGRAKRLKVSDPAVSVQSSKQVDVAPPSSPSDPSVKKAADRLANFVAKHGRKMEHTTHQKNPGDTPFKFLYDQSCSDYKYYEYRLSEEEKALSESQLPPSVLSKRYQTNSNYHVPTSALYHSTEEDAGASNEAPHASSAGMDPIAMMEYYMKKAAQEEKRRPPKPSKDEMPPPESLQVHEKKGHHMGDYIPPDELEKFLATCNDAGARKAAREAAAKAKIQADNIGHKLLSKMGWKEGSGLGSSGSGMADPIMAGDVKKDNLGVGAHAPGEVSADDDIYEQYKKRMMLGYKHRPNPLGNPRKSYY